MKVQVQVPPEHSMASWPRDSAGPVLRRLAACEIGSRLQPLLWVGSAQRVVFAEAEGLHADSLVNWRDRAALPPRAPSRARGLCGEVRACSRTPAAAGRDADARHWDGCQGGPRSGAEQQYQRGHEYSEGYRSDAVARTVCPHAGQVSVQCEAAGPAESQGRRS